MYIYIKSVVVVVFFFYLFISIVYHGILLGSSTFLYDTNK